MSTGMKPAFDRFGASQSTTTASFSRTALPIPPHVQHSFPRNPAIPSTCAVAPTLDTTTTTVLDLTQESPVSAVSGISTSEPEAEVPVTPNDTYSISKETASVCIASPVKVAHVTPAVVPTPTLVITIVRTATVIYCMDCGLVAKYCDCDFPI